ncbi:MAG: hypothetical protein IV090_26535 [Candidatus Sericytochromatia bacterium]|nr:hypothetical protein [Candidatus Sericytochromatia bacterium]
MRKNWVIRLLMLVFSFFPLQVWAETIQASPPRLSITRLQGLPEAHAASPAQTQSETIALSANPWWAELNQTEPVAPLGLGGIQIQPWIWNIVDAIQMNERLLSASPKQAEEINPEEINQEEMKQELQAKLDAFMTLAENNQLQMGATGPYLNHRLLYF